MKPWQSLTWVVVYQKAGLVPIFCWLVLLCSYFTEVSSRQSSVTRLRDGHVRYCFTKLQAYGIYCSFPEESILWSHKRKRDCVWRNLFLTNTCCLLLTLFPFLICRSSFYWCRQSLSQVMSLAINKILCCSFKDCFTSSCRNDLYKLTAFPEF